MKFPPYRVLIVDDHPIICDGHEKYLSNLVENYLGYQFGIVSADTFEKALFEVINSVDKNQPFDLILIDVRINTGREGKKLDKRIFMKSPNSKVFVLKYVNSDFGLISILNQLMPKDSLIESGELIK